ncbi:hypothetical protein QVD17_33162 [Tagetes erecta]|uniref:Uncharacterized protein n=1 Tax=Tagetes erecta TaxID=13708 RepID=A0AAD8K0M3_TARER|nr:hypothetical protein QVD17_33162 [Tagetes erecta]
MSSKNVDDLPEDIVSYILSLMPTKFAVQTSIISKRWRYRWMFVTNLDFDDIHHFQGQTSTFSNSVNHVIKSCKSSQIQLFRLHFSEWSLPNSCVSYWIDEAVRLNVCELDLYASLVIMPLSFFSSKTLTKLILHEAHGRVFDLDWRFPCQVYLPCLITLDIIFLAAPIADAFKLIRGCPALENLSLKVLSNNKERKYIFNLPTLKRLEIVWASWEYPIDIIVLGVPNLEYLDLNGEKCSTFVMEEMSSLVEASVSFFTLSNLSLFSCKTLTKLSLHDGSNGPLLVFPCQFTFPCVNTLDINLSMTPLANAIDLIHNCPNA